MQKISPESPVVYWFRGRYWQQSAGRQSTPEAQNSYQQKAVEDFTTALRLEPKVHIFYELRAASLKALGRLEEAKSDIAEAARLAK